MKNKVELFTSYVLEVLCSNNQEMFDYMMKWTADIVRGNKNGSLLYLKGPEGIGKSKFSDFLSDYVLGRHNVCKSDAQPLKKGPTRVFIPLRGFSFPDRENLPHWEPEGNKAFIDSLKGNLKPTISLTELDAHINDPESIDPVVEAFLSMMKAKHSS